MPAVVVAIVASGVWALAEEAPGPEGMVCRPVVVVEYHAGPNADRFRDHVQGHLDHLRAQMKAGNLIYAGPFEEGLGGLSIYVLDDLAEVDKLVSKDPVVAKKVLTYSMRRWRMCRPDDSQTEDDKG